MHALYRAGGTCLDPQNTSSKAAVLHIRNEPAWAGPQLDYQSSILPIDHRRPPAEAGKLAGAFAWKFSNQESIARRFRVELPFRRGARDHSPRRLQNGRSIGYKMPAPVARNERKNHRQAPPRVFRRLILEHRRNRRRLATTGQKNEGKVRTRQGKRVRHSWPPRKRIMYLFFLFGRACPISSPSPLSFV